ncbi:MAG: type IV pilin protein [Gammaproteobacteria bacterium]|nr:type IV pilin protein [Gammaproteobacteria bacterium]
MNKQIGFTLLELMIVVAIIGILSAVAIPSYQESVKKSKRAEAQAALTSFAGAMERHMTENDSYKGAASGGADTGSPSIYSASVPVEGVTVNYNLTIDAATASTYTLKATRTGSMSSDNCGDFTITNTGVKNIENNTGGYTKNDCW